MTRAFLTKQFFLFTFLISLFTFSFAESFTDFDFGYSLDLPEGYNIKDYTEDGKAYFLEHPNIPVSLVIKVIENEKSEKTALKSQLDKLNAKSQLDTFKWNEKDCSFGSFSMTLDQDYAGWAAGAALKNAGTYIVLLCYAPKDKEEACQQFILSSLNSLSTSFENFISEGLVVSYAFPKEGKISVKLNIDGCQINSFLDKSDSEAAKWLVDMEYSVLTLYANHNLWKEAWQRYYRIIYKDEAPRIANISEDIYKALWQKAEIENPENPDISYAQKLLSWVQTFDYLRAKTAEDSDFTSLPDTILGKGNDCDSRSMLICALLKACGTESLMLISREYSHAMAAALIEAPGQTYNLPGTKLNFLMGETTAKVTWGMIAQDQADRSKWIEVLFP